MERSLRVLVPQIIPGISHAGFAFDGKQDLLTKLPQRLNGYRHWAGRAGLGLVVVIDQDDDDCRELRGRLDRCAIDLSMTCCSLSSEVRGDILNRIAIEELEAWFFGDVVALAKTYPGVPKTLGARSKYRDPDSITGGTWEALEDVLQDAGHHLGGLAKMRAAQEIASNMDVEVNRSYSFQKFRDGLRLLVHGGSDAQA